MDLLQNPLAFVALLIGVPALVTGLALLAGRKLRGAELGWVGAVAVGAGYCAGHAIVVKEWPAWMPAQTTTRLFYAAAIVTVAAVVASPRRIGAIAASAILGIGHVLAMSSVLGHVLASEPTLRRWTFAAAALLAAASVTYRFERVAETTRGAFAPLLMWITVTCAAVANALTGSIVYAQFCGAVSATLGAAVVFGWMFRDTSFARGLCWVAYLQMLALCFAANRVSELPATAMLALIAAPWLAGGLTQPFEKRWTPRKLFVVRLASVAVPCAVALASAYANHLAHASPY